MKMRGRLSSRATVQGDIYRSGGGGSTVEITPVYNTGTKIADYSINGEDGAIYIPKYTESVLYTYTGNARQITLNLNDSITNYDALIITFGWVYLGSNFETIDIIPSSKIESNYFICTGGEGRYNYISRGSNDLEIILATSTGSWDGASIIREIRGVKF